MNEIFSFLQACKTFYLATTEGNQPRVRPFGAVNVYNERLYICTNNKKSVSKQMKENPKIEISAALNGKWLRLTAEAVLDDDRNARQAMLDVNPGLQGMYSVDDGIYEVFYLKNATGTICSFSGENETHTF